MVLQAQQSTRHPNVILNALRRSKVGGNNGKYARRSSHAVVLVEKLFCEYDLELIGPLRTQGSPHAQKGHASWRFQPPPPAG